jgi:hypothetical protein
MVTMSVPFPAPTTPFDSREQVFLAYLDYFRSTLVGKLSGLPDDALRVSRLPSGWTPLELAKHLTFVEMRWLEWGFEGAEVTNPWGDGRAGRWYVDPAESSADVVAALTARGVRTRAIVEAHSLDDVGAESERWDGEPPPQLERILYHLLQEYARHVGHLDIVRELEDGMTGE